MSFRKDIAPLQTLVNVLVAAVLCATSACKKSSSDSDDDEEEPQRGTVVVVPGGAPASDGKTAIPVSITDAFGGSFSLYQTASEYTIQLSGCLSGLTGTVTESNLDGLEVYTFDRGCLAKLTQFTVGGTVYYPTVSDPFTT